MSNTNVLIINTKFKAGSQPETLIAKIVVDGDTRRHECWATIAL